MKYQTIVHNLDDLHYIQELENRISELKEILEDERSYIQRLERELSEANSNGEYYK